MYLLDNFCVETVMLVPIGVDHHGHVVLAPHVVVDVDEAEHDHVPTDFTPEILNSINFGFFAPYLCEKSKLVGQN